MLAWSETSRARRCAALLGLATLVSCAADSSFPREEPSPEGLGEKSQSVIGGSEASDCAWPSTVRVQSASLCTGTLIHPRIVTTAAHCLSGSSATISFGARGAPDTFSVMARCVAGARGEQGVNTANDWGYCVLPEDARIAAVPVTPPLVGCEAKLLQTGAPAWVVGYGATYAQGSVGGKREVEVKVNAFNKLAPGTIDVGDRQKGGCHGDSGGPLYVRLVQNGIDYGVRVAGSTSGPGSSLCDCSCSTTYVAIENHVRAIEQKEGIDVTPCTDAVGNWQPSPACRDFPSDPEHGTGSYPACTFARTTAAIESCGPNTLSAAQDGGLDAGNTTDASVASDAGNTDSTGKTFDAAQSSDAGVGGNERQPEASLVGVTALADAGWPAHADTLPEAGGGDAALVPTGLSAAGSTPFEAGIVLDGAHAAGCSAARGRGRPGAVFLTLLTAALCRLRRRRPRTAA